MAYYLFIFTHVDDGENFSESYCIEASCLLTAHEDYCLYIADLDQVRLKKVIIERIR